jgi:hypothetical protein
MADENEANFMRRVMLQATKRGNRLFRNNVALGWVGKLVAKENGRVVLDNARPLHAGLCVGSSDLIGWTRVTITPDMVGLQIAVFTGVETKSSRGVVRQEQQLFQSTVRTSGGIAEVVRTLEEMDHLILGR